MRIAICADSQTQIRTHTLPGSQTHGHKHKELFPPKKEEEAAANNNKGDRRRD